MKKAYICSPLRSNEKQDINNAISYAKFVYERCGMIPIMPHFYAFIFDDKDKSQKELGISISLGKILDCTDIWVFGNTVTKKMKQEIQNAKALKRNIHYITDEQCEEILKVYGGNYIL